MTQHPHQLHAQAALWSLRAALHHLDENREAFLTRRAPAPTRPRSAGALARLDELLRAEKAERKAGSLNGLKPSAGSPAPVDLTFADVDRAINEALVEAHTTLRYAHHRDPLLAWSRHWPDLLAEWGVRRDPRWSWIAAVLPATPAGIAEAAGLALAHADAIVRAAIGLDVDQLVPPLAPPCQACDRRRLRVQTSAPDSARWTIVCSPSCLCGGDRCIPCGEECEPDCDGHPCSMDVPTRGVPHIWASDSPLAASIHAGINTMGLAA